ncbi:hypothetical protein V5N11_015980 [Cardamine amara subsp. amara]|uniref:Uncharacterized protein n=1 Tax=Cardamine amara subsp. amara TaxID=228776 RepID=A0ABD1ASG6_CARAN
MSSPYFPLFFPDTQASSEVVVTPEQLKAFHHIDRTLFSRLVFVLNREMNESFEVFCFLYLLEQAGYARDLIYYLVSKPDDFINSLANEIVVCLNFLYNEDFSLAFFVANTDDEHNSLIPAVFQLTRGKITLRFIHQNRQNFLQELTKNMRHSCRRALADLLVTPQPDLLVRPQPDLHNKEKLSDLEADKLIEMMQKFSLTNTAQQGSTSRSSVQPETTLRPMSVREETTLRPMSVQQETTLRPMSVRPETTMRAPMFRPETTYRPSVRAETTYRPIYRPETTYRPVYRQEATYRPVFRQEAAYRPVYRQETIYRPVVRNVMISSPSPNVEEEEEAKALEERTVFLTFSKGYPITEEEVRAFFTKWFGEVIESIEMQDVEVHGQALFAKMLLKKSCLSKMEDIVTPTSKNKYTINGKHVWARKYIPNFGPSASSSSSPI